MTTGYAAILLALLLCTGVPALAGDDLPDFDRMWDHSKPDETEKRFRELLGQAEASGDLDYHLQLLTQIARTQGLQKRFEDAHATLDEVEAELEGASPTTRIRYLLERGRTFNSSKKTKDARTLFLAAYELGVEKKVDFYALDAAHMMAIVEPQEEKLGWNEKALKIAETSEDPRARLWLGALYNNIGWTLYYLGRHEEALEIHRKGWSWRKERAEQAAREGPDRSSLIAQWSVAKVLRALKRHDEALALQRELLEAYEELEQEDGFVHEELAENLLALGRPEEAKPHFVKAWALLKDVDWLDDDEPGRRERLRRMAEAETE